MAKPRKSNRRSDPVKVVFGSVRSGGGRDVTVYIPDVRLRVSRNGSLYHIVDAHGKLPLAMECEGTVLQARVVVKIYAKVPVIHFQKHAYNRAISKLKAGMVAIVPPIRQSKRKNRERKLLCGT